MQFKDVIVSPETVKQLLKQVHEHRISHAQLYLAQPGSHAFALALAMGQYLCCEHPTETDSCGECPSCIQFAKLTHPDLHIYFPNCTTNEVKKDPDSLLLAKDFREYALSNNMHIDISTWLETLKGENKQPSINIRDCSHIINQNSIRSYMGGYKIYILWNADRLNVAAAPKLLKTLEEPEPQSLFILITEKPDQMLSTILSRTQLIKIPRLTEEELAIALMKAHPEVSNSEAQKIAILSEGNYNKAEQILRDGSSELELMQAAGIMLKSAVNFAKQQPLQVVNYEGVIEEFDKIAKTSREQQKSFIAVLLKLLRDILIANTGNGEMLKSTEEEARIIAQFQGMLNIKHITLMTDECNKALYHIGRNGNANIVFPDLYFKLAGCLK
ncbi:MAG: hypothetical protein MJZ57_04660 [Bacteroidales bacterium]|nr:hypothetical protein [Bacteroidales bacterium]